MAPVGWDKGRNAINQAPVPAAYYIERLSVHRLIGPQLLNDYTTGHLVVTVMTLDGYVDTMT